MHDVLSLSATRQARLIRERKLSSVELITATLDRISSLQPSLNAVTNLLADRALGEARRADALPPTGPLHGVPFSIKDSIELCGTACTAGTDARRNAEPSHEDATVISRLRRAGAIPIAKTNLPELLFAFESDNFVFGRTANPYDLSRTPGGSSGGEAALIAALGSPMGLGSDAAGSVRLPAAFCGIAAIKPTSGRLPRTGHFPPAAGFIEALWQIGPMARYVEDVALMMQLLAGADDIDRTAVPLAFQAAAEQDLAALRVAFFTGNGLVEPDIEVAEVVRAAASALQPAVRCIDEDRPQCVSDAFDLEMKLLGSDGGDALRDYHASLGSKRMHPLLAAWLDKLECYRTDLRGFRNYWSEWDAYRAKMTAFLRKYDLVLCPAYTRAALPHGVSIEDRNFRGFSYTMAYNVAGLPAAVVRCGTSSEGLPLAVQIVAHPWRDDLALAAAAFLEHEICGAGWNPAAG